MASRYARWAIGMPCPSSIIRQNVFLQWKEMIEFHIVPIRFFFNTEKRIINR